MKLVIISASLVALTLIGVAPLLVLWTVTPTAPSITVVPGTRVIDFPAGKLRLQERGAGPDAIVLLHGFNGQLGHWNDVWSALPDSPSLRMIRLDLPGYGESAWRVDDFGLPAQGQRLIHFLDELEIERATLVGGSMGGSLAAWVAAKYPDRVVGLVLLAPSGFTDGLRYLGLFGMLVRPGKLNAVATWLARTRVYGMSFPESKALQALTVTATYGPDWVEALSSIEAPTVIAWSRGDLGVSYTVAPAVQAAIPHGQLLWLDDQTGHLVPRTRPALVAELVLQMATSPDPDNIGSHLPPELLHQGEVFEEREP